MTQGTTPSDPPPRRHAVVDSSRRELPDSVELADFTTVHTGGPADRLIVGRSEPEIIGVVRATDDADTPLLVLSGGSNLLVSDDGFAGTVLAMANLGIEASLDDDGHVLVRVAAGEVWDHVVAQTVARGWRGLELLSGIPGLTGAAAVQNIGAYGADIATVVTGLRAYDRQQHQIVTLTAADCQFGYRTSLFKHQPDRYVVLSVSLQLEADDHRAGGTYPELADRLGGGSASLPIGLIRREVLALRASKSTLYDPTDHDSWSAGSFFKNPVVDPDRVADLPATAPRWTTPGGAVKLSAAWLIEQAGYPRGFSQGRAGLSTKHALVLTNRGGASTADIAALARAIQTAVARRFGVNLEPEVVLVGVNLKGFTD